MPHQQENFALLPPQVAIPVEPTSETIQEFKLQVTQNQIEQKYLIDSFLNNPIPKPILLLACEGHDRFAEVLPETVQLLVDKGANIHYIDHEHYGWESIHYAASATNPKNLQVICDKMKPERINTLTALSENALHVLLNHGESSSTFTISCQNGEDFKMTKIINKEHDNITECARVLIEKKIDVNHPNFWNETPILIAIKRKYFNVVELLLKEQVDLDGCKDAVSGKSARELLKGRNFVLSTSTITKPPQKMLFELLKSGDEKAFLNFNGGNLKKYCEVLDGDGKDNSSCTLLQYCYRRSLIFWHQEKSDYQRSEDITTDGMVEVFCKTGAKCVLHLLEQGVKDVVKLDKFQDKRTVLEAAITKGFYPMVALILDKTDNGELPIEAICTALLVLVETNQGVDLNNTLSVVLTRLVDNVSGFSKQVLEKLSLLLEKGIKNKKINVNNQLLLLKFYGSLNWTDQKMESDSSKLNGLMKVLQDKLPSLFSSPRKSVLEKVDPEVLKAHLDNCVTQEGADIVINCNSLMGTSLPSVLELYLFPPLCELLKHVVFKIFIMRQWNNLKPKGTFSMFKYLYINLCFHFIFYIFLNGYILVKFSKLSVTVIFTFWLFSFIFCICFIIKEIIQICSNIKMYLKDKTNYMELIFGGVTLWTLLWPLDSKNFWDTLTLYSTTSDIFEVLTVLISNVVLLGMLSTLPIFARYTIILRTIEWYFYYWFFYLIHFIAFSICFYILFTKDDNVGLAGLSNKFFDTIILFTGNLDYMETPWKQESNTTTLYHQSSYNEFFAKIIFIIFVFFVSIILQNLFLGLLVFDISNLQKEVAVAEQVKRASFIVRAYKIINSGLATKIFGEFSHTNVIIEKNVKVLDKDREPLTEDERQQLDFILTKQREAPNVLKNLKNHIKKRIKERRCENGRKDKILLEELIKKLEDMT